LDDVIERTSADEGAIVTLDDVIESGCDEGGVIATLDDVTFVSPVNRKRIRYHMMLLLPTLSVAVNNFFLFLAVVIIRHFLNKNLLVLPQV
jgi:hypothetical protein